MSLANWQLLMYKDSISFYREVLDSVTGDSLGYRLYSGPYPCNFQRTPNYDKHSSPAGASKEDNIFTADGARMQFDADFDALDMAHVTSRLGDTAWESVKGAPQRRQLLSYCTCYLVPSQAPTVIP